MVTDDGALKLAKLGAIIEHHLNRIRSVYAEPGAIRLTLVIRRVDSPDGSRNVVVTDDEIEDVVTALRLAEGASHG